MSALLGSPLVVLRMGLAACAQPQDRVVQGAVRHNTGESLLGAGVRVESAAVGMTAAAAGCHLITVPKGGEAVLINFVGLAPPEITSGNCSEMDVTLQVGGHSLGAMVAMGHDSEKKSSITGSVASSNSQGLLVGPHSRATYQASTTSFNHA